MSDLSLTKFLSRSSPIEKTSDGVSFVVIFSFHFRKK